ncbi:hypothetical protein NWQ33_02560 [Mycoplasmopsis cynos]|nr:hypothetical protein [Mycoplasmopsis cynos]
MIKPENGKVKWFVRVIFDNKSKDEFKLNIDKRTNHFMKSRI